MENVQRPKLSSVVGDQIINLILERGIKPGEKLPSETHLIQSLGIGRTSVREAVKKLEGLGLLTSRQGYGVVLNKVTIETLFKDQDKFLLFNFVTITQKDMSDWLALRFLIESDACRLAAEKIDSEALSRLEQTLNAMSRHFHSPHRFAEYDIEFHNIIVEVSQNRIYSLVHNMILNLFFKQRIEGAYVPGSMDTAYTDHQRILEAIKKCDAQSAEKEMRSHLVTARAVWNVKD